MAGNASRFIIIDGVQYSRERAHRLGLVDDSGDLVKHKGKVNPDTVEETSPVDETDASPAGSEEPTVEKPSSSRARGSATARKG